VTKPKIDPELHALIPPLAPEELKGLESSLKSEGCRDALVIWEGENILLDGHNRLEICQINGIAFRTTDLSFSNRNAAKMWVIRNQLARRNLKPLQRIALVRHLEAIMVEEAKERQKVRKGKQPGATPQKSADLKPCETRKEMAKLAGVSHDTYTKGKKVLDSKDEETIKKTKSGEISINKAYRKLEKQKKQQEREASRKKAVRSHGSGHSIITGDFREKGVEIPSNSVDLIFTDPPYNKQAVKLYDGLAEFGQRILRPGGLCLAYSGQVWFPHVLAAMREHLEYVWCFAVSFTGGQLRYRKLNLHNAWKPIVAFIKPPLDCWWEPFSDLISGGKAKESHEWEQPEAEATYFIERLCPEKGMVVDPFCGSGTTLVAAKRLGRNFVGFEIDAGVAASARERISK